MKQSINKKNDIKNYKKNSILNWELSNIVFTDTEWVNEENYNRQYLY